MKKKEKKKEEIRERMNKKKNLRKEYIDHWVPTVKKTSTNISLIFRINYKGNIRNITPLLYRSGENKPLSDYIHKWVEKISIESKETFPGLSSHTPTGRHKTSTLTLLPQTRTIPS